MWWYSAALLIDMLQTGTVPPDPFFSNDLEGWLKVGGVIGAIWLFIWRRVDTPYAHRIGALETEHAETKRRRDVIDARLNNLERDALVMSNNLRGLDESFGDVSAKLERLITRIDERDDRTVAALGKLAERVASMESTMRRQRESDQ